MHRTLITSAFAALLLPCSAIAAAAQTTQDPTEPAPSNRPYRGLFGGGDVAAPGLSLLLSTSGGYDTNVLAEQPGGGNSGPNPRQGAFSGEFVDGSGTLAYLFARGDTTFSVTGSSNVRYYPQLPNPTTHSHSVAAAQNFVFGSWTVGLRESLQYSSFYHLVPGFPAAVPGAPAPVAPSLDSSVAPHETFGYDTGLEVIQRLGARNSIRYHYTRRHTDTGFADRRLLTQGAGAVYRRGMTRYGGLRLGYSYQEANYSGGAAASTRMHNLDCGFDYARPLSFSRRTTVAFSGGMQMLEQQLSRFYRFQGTGQLTHEFGRTWALNVLYDRGAQFVDIVDQPMYADTVSAHVGGFLVGRRLELSIDGAYSNGSLSYTTNRSGLVTYNGSARLEWALSNRWTFFGSYGYYSYDFGEDITLPADVLETVNRHSVRAGVRVWLPLMTQRGNRGTR